MRYKKFTDSRLQTLEEKEARKLQLFEELGAELDVK